MNTHDPDPELRDLMQKTQDGDEHAYARLLQEVTGIVRPYLYNKLRDATYFEDLVQDILLSIHKARHTYDSSRPFLPWMFAIARFRLQDHFRGLYRERKYEFTDVDSIKDTLAAPDEHEYEKAQIIRKSLLLLPPKQRIVIEMMHVEGYTAQEVADKTGMSQSAVKVSAHRAYKLLAKCFRNEAS